MLVFVGVCVRVCMCVCVRVCVRESVCVSKHADGGGSTPTGTTVLV
jgi:hypothetical protein